MLRAKAALLQGRFVAKPAGCTDVLLLSVSSRVRSRDEAAAAELGMETRRRWVRQSKGDPSMAMNIHWAPRSYTKHLIDVGSPSAFIAMLTEVFGEPLILTLENDVSRLRDMKVAYHHLMPGAPNPFDELLGALRKYPEIEITVER
jgi:hypothetical protein